MPGSHQVHRFCDTVAVALDIGNGNQTVYLSKVEALKIGFALADVVMDIDNHKAADSKCGTFSIKG